MPFRDIIGHRALVTLLARSAERGAVPPSLIFAGPAGVGKRLVALATAQALNCPNPQRKPSRPPDEHANAPEFDACGSCPTCTRIMRGVHPDVVLLEPGDNGSIRIEAVRDVIERAGYRPFEGRRRVVIFDDADALVAAAQNALLKTLEEPPSASMFILVTSRPDSLLPTVRSRCPRLRFRPLGPGEVAAALVRSGKSETEARAIAASADGSIGRALESSADEQLEARDAAIRVLATAAQTQDPRRRLDATKDLLAKTGGGGASDREALAAVLRAMASILRDTALLAARADARSVANTDVLPALERLTVFQGERGVRAFEAVDQGLVALQRNAGVKIVADWVAVSI